MNFIKQVSNNIFKVGVSNLIVKYLDEETKFFKLINTSRPDIVIKHLKLSSEIQRLCNINNFIMQEFRSKKGIFRNGKYHFNNITILRTYQKLCELNEIYKSINLRQDLSSKLNDILHQELKNDYSFPLNCIYYWKNYSITIPFTLKFDTFDKKDWILDSTTSITYHDYTKIDRIINFNMKFLRKVLYHYFKNEIKFGSYLRNCINNLEKISFEILKYSHSI